MKFLFRIAPLFLMLLASPSLDAQEKHKVKDDETLFSISQRYGVEVEDIRKANELGGEPIEPGQVLRIPESSEKSGTDTVLHTVKEGETLYSICKKYNADIDLVLQLNPEASKQVEIGQKLRIPVGTDPPDKKDELRAPFDTTKAGYHYHPVKKGNTLFSISQRYGVPIDTIRAENAHLKKEPEVGQVLRIPKSDSSMEAEKDPLALPEDLSLKGFRVHKVRKGETLYSIARRNGLTLEHLIRSNPHLEGQLKVDQAIRIPEGGSRTPRSHSDTLILHQVKEGESIRSIATMYGTEPALIILANELFYRDVQVGEWLLVPIPPRTPDTPPRGSEMKDRYRVTLLLPLYLSENDSIYRNPPAEEAPELYGASSYALDFYEGFRIAADSVARKTGISFDVRTIATRKDQADLTEVLKEKKVRKSDLVVGPFYSSNLEPTAKYLKGSGAHLVCPVRHSNQVLLGRPFISKVIPSSVTLIEQLAEHLAVEHGHRNVLLLNSGDPKDDRREKIFKERFDRLLTKNDSAYRDSLRVVPLDDKLIERLEKVLKKDTLNVLAVPSKDKVFASRILNQLSKLNDRLGSDANYPIKVYASEDWKDFSTVDIKYKEHFKLHIITGRHIQHDSVPAERFYRSFRQRNNTDPGSYGFLGHDVARFYLNALASFGTRFDARFDRVKARTLHMGFDMFRTGVSSGYENRFSFLIRYTKEHRIQRMKTR